MRCPCNARSTLADSRVRRESVSRCSPRRSRLPPHRCRPSALACESFVRRGPFGGPSSRPPLSSVSLVRRSVLDRRPQLSRRGSQAMADWDVIAKHRLTEDWSTLRAAYLPLNQAMRRTIEFLDKGGGTFDELLSVVRERMDGALHNLTALTNRRSPWVRLEAIRRSEERRV